MTFSTNYLQSLGGAADSIAAWSIAAISTAFIIHACIKSIITGNVRAGFQGVV
jgi:hypothetical protein